MEALQQIITILTSLIMALSAQLSGLPNNVQPTSQLAAAAPTTGLVGWTLFGRPES
jgi:hypothetical protein